MAPEEFDENEPLLGSAGNPLPESFCMPAPPAALRAEVLARTSRAVRSRGRRRRAWVLCALAGAYAAGAASVYAFGTVSASNPAVRIAVKGPATVAPLPEPAAAPGRKPGEATEFSEELVRDPERFALFLVQQPAERRREALKRAGDYHLNVAGDLQLALKCYESSLDLMPKPSVSDFNATDTWLLRSLKLARIEEVSHENEHS